MANKEALCVINVIYIYFIITATSRYIDKDINSVNIDNIIVESINYFHEIFKNLFLIYKAVKKKL